MKKNNILKDIYRNILINENAAFVIDKELFQNNLNEMLTSFRQYYPKVSIGYSYKTNYIPSICSIAHELGCWAETVSEMEVDMAMINLTDRSNIIFNGPIKSEKSLTDVILNNGIINVDNKKDLSLIKKIVEKSGQTVNLALRLNFSYESNDSRFGLDMISVDEIMLDIIDNPKLNFIGFHVHLPFRSLDSYLYRIESLISVLEKYNHLPISYINIGGGFFGNLDENSARSLGIQSPPTYHDYAKIIGERISAYFSSKNETEWPMLFIEPGTSVVADVLSFISKIHTIKTIDLKKIIVTYAARHLLSPTNKVVQMPVQVGEYFDKSSEEMSETTYFVAGYTCIESDILGKVVHSPINEEDNFIIVNNVGSYSIVMGSDFILPQPPIYLFFDKELKLIRSRKTTEEIMKGFLC